MARMDYADPDASTERIRELLGKLDHKNIFRMLAHSPSHFETYVRMGNAIRFKGELNPCLRELAITRTGILCQSDYEVIAHKRIGKDVGLSDEKLDALEEGPERAVLPPERDVLLRDVRKDHPEREALEARADVWEELAQAKQLVDQ